MYAYEFDGIEWVLEEKLVAEDARSFAGFGNAVVLAPTYLMVGAIGDHDRGPGAGAAYVFQRDAGGWTQQAKLTASDGDTSDGFGASVALQGDYAIVGALRNEVHGVETGSAYVFHREGAEWVEQAWLAPDDGEEDDLFGVKVGISGEYVTVGAPSHADGLTFSGAVYVFRREGAKWPLVAKLQASPRLRNGEFGMALAMRGNRLLVGAPTGGDCGSAFLFELQGDAYVQVERFYDPPIFDGMGTSVSFSGEHVVVGAEDADLGAGIWSGAAFIYRLGAEGPLDIRDFAVFQTCFTGPEGGRLSDCCKLLDFDDDRDVDRADFDAFIDRFTGP